jgi:hypothetical protein
MSAYAPVSLPASSVTENYEARFMPRANAPPARLFLVAPRADLRSSSRWLVRRSAHESPGPRFRAINARFERLYQ